MLYVSGVTSEVLAVSEPLTVTGPVVEYVRPSGVALGPQFWNETVAIRVTTNSHHSGTFSGDTVVLSCTGSAPGRASRDVSIKLPEAPTSVVLFAEKYVLLRRVANF